MNKFKHWSVTSPLGKALRKLLHFAKFNIARLRGAEPNVEHFDSKQFYLKDSGKRDAFLSRHLYMDDEGAAVCYAFGVNYIDHAAGIGGEDFKQEVDAIVALKTRVPKLAVNVGCGLGMIDAAITYGGTRCVGVDPSPGAREGYGETFAHWLGVSEFAFVNQRAHEGLAGIVSAYGTPDTIIMCEAIEHIPKDEFDKFWAIAVPLLRASRGRFIITNGLSDYHFPIVVDGTGWCHIREVDDALYDQLARDAESTLIRHRGHLVLQF